MGEGVRQGRRSGESGLNAGRQILHSDTTIISSMAAATDHIDHVRTQLPYALLAGGAAAVCFAVLGATL